MSNAGPNGFTLLELSIVLVIVGLITGGVLVGRDLIEAAMIHRQITQIEQLKVAVTTFTTKFNDLPGVVRANNAATFGMTPRSGALGHGDGDGIRDACDNSSASYLGCESALFWNDLSTAGLISESFTAATDTQLAVTPDQLNNFLPAAVLGNNPVAGRNHIAVFSDTATDIRSGAPFLAQCNQRICFALNSPGPDLHGASRILSGRCGLERRGLRRDAGGGVCHRHQNGRRETAYGKRFGRIARRQFESQYCRSDQPPLYPSGVGNFWRLSLPRHGG